MIPCANQSKFWSLIGYLYLIEKTKIETKKPTMDHLKMRYSFTTAMSTVSTTTAFIVNGKGGTNEADEDESDVETARDQQVVKILTSSCILARLFLFLVFDANSSAMKHLCANEENELS